MNKLARRVFLVASLLLSASIAAAPLNLEGSIAGAPYRIVVPDNWNGTLLVFEDGYEDVADAPGEVDLRTPQVAYPGTEDLFLAQGYALAGSAFRVNGYNIEEGIEDTWALMAYFRLRVGNPRHAIIVGLSGGSTRAAKILETFPGFFDGGVSTCGVLAGTPLFFDRALDFAVAYQAAFGWPAAWGTPGNVRDDLDFEIDVADSFFTLLSDPANFGRFEFIRLVNGIPLEGFYDGDQMLVIQMFFTTEARAQMERKFGAPATQNLDHRYRLAAADRAYLASLGVDADPLLANMNAHRIYAADRAVRREVSFWGAFDGDLKRPLLSMHAIGDGLATPDHEYVYRSIVNGAGRSDLLKQVWTNGVGHCTFTPEQVSTAVSAMDSWIRTGVKPRDSQFPESLDFNHHFSPPPWPYPTN